MLRPSIVLLAFLIAARTLGQSNSEAASVALSASVQKSPARVTLSWTTLPSTTSITIYRKLRSATNWGSALATPAASATSYQDNTVALYTAYEYRVVRIANGNDGTGYIASGIEVPASDYRGKLVLLVDNTFSTSLANELTQLQNDMKADGWTVLRNDVSRTASVTSVRNTVKSHYNSDPANVKALFIVGHVPVPYSGELNPDGHSEHKGAWPCDGYYGDMDGTWTDNTVDRTTAARTENYNVPGDGKFDQNDFATGVELQVGRVDMYDMPAFSQGETQLLRNYMNKLHAYKVKDFAPQERGLVYDNLQWVAQGLAATGWRCVPPLVGNANTTYPNVAGLPFSSYVNGQSYLWTYSSGAGQQAITNGVLTYNGAVNVGYTEELATNVSMGGVFNLSFGSYYGDWDNKNNFLRAMLASGDGLTSGYGSKPSWFMHTMGMGEPIGTCVQITMNNTSIYTPAADGGMSNLVRAHLALLGDPTLRLRMIKPPMNLAVTKAGSLASFAWTASTETVLGYNIDRVNADGTLTRMNTSLITGTTFQDASVLFTSGAEYMVRATKLQITASGSFFNHSLAAFATAAATGGSPDCAGVVGGSATIGTSCNDGNACTTNDTWNSSCQCLGTAVVPTATITPASSTAVCNGSSVTLNATTGNGYSYAWKRDGTAIAGATASSYNASVAGSHTVTITKNSCALSSAATTVTVKTLPSVSTSADDAASTVSAAANGATAPYTYAWNTNPLQTSATATVTSAGTYTVTATSANGCSKNASVSISPIGGGACTGLRTESQATWGAVSNGTDPAAYLAAYYDWVFAAPDNIVIGSGTRKLKLTTAAAITAFLPSSGTAAKLPSGTLVNPGNGYSNGLAGELVALKLTLKFDEFNPAFSTSEVMLKDMVIASGPFAGYTVSALAAEADNKLGSSACSFSLTQLQTAISTINNGYEGGNEAAGYLLCNGVVKDGVAGGSQDAGPLPEEDMDITAFPNPFSGVTTLAIHSMGEPAHVTVAVYNMTGVLEERLFDGEMAAGADMLLQWDASTRAKGMYFYRLTRGGKPITGKLMVE
ncbi:MAG: T9SS type A sorting domain-containing protein [Flavobacteriales bacterium]